MLYPQHRVSQISVVWNIHTWRRRVATIIYIVSRAIWYLYPIYRNMRQHRVLYMREMVHMWRPAWGEYLQYSRITGHERAMYICMCLMCIQHTHIREASDWIFNDSLRIGFICWIIWQEHGIYCSIWRRRAASHTCCGFCVIFQTWLYAFFKVGAIFVWIFFYIGRISEAMGAARACIRRCSL